MYRGPGGQQGARAATVLLCPACMPLLKPQAPWLSGTRGGGGGELPLPLLTAYLVGQNQDVAC